MVSSDSLFAAKHLRPEFDSGTGVQKLSVEREILHVPAGEGNCRTDYVDRSSGQTPFIDKVLRDGQPRCSPPFVLCDLRRRPCGSTQGCPKISDCKGAVEGGRQRVLARMTGAGALERNDYA